MLKWSPRRAALKQLLRILCNKVKMEHLWRKLLRVRGRGWGLAKAGSGTKAEFVAKVERVQGAAVLR